MEVEKFLSGYCRQLDAARTVCAVVEDGEITEVDCCYGTCPHQASCSMAKEMDELK